MYCTAVSPDSQRHFSRKAKCFIIDGYPPSSCDRPIWSYAGQNALVKGVFHRRDSGLYKPAGLLCKKWLSTNVVMFYYTLSCVCEQGYNLVSLQAAPGQMMTIYHLLHSECFLPLIIVDSLLIYLALCYLLVRRHSQCPCLLNIKDHSWTVSRDIQALLKFSIKWNTECGLLLHICR